MLQTANLQVTEHAAKLKQWLGGPYIALQWRVEKCIERKECDTNLLLRCAQGEGLGGVLRFDPSSRQRSFRESSEYVDFLLLPFEQSPF